MSPCVLAPWASVRAEAPGTSMTVKPLCLARTLLAVQMANSGARPNVAKRDPLVKMTMVCFPRVDSLCLVNCDCPLRHFNKLKEHAAGERRNRGATVWLPEAIVGTLVINGYRGLGPRRAYELFSQSAQSVVLRTRDSPQLALPWNSATTRAQDTQNHVYRCRI